MKHLTQSRGSLFKVICKLKSDKIIYKTWTNCGKIYLIKNEGDDPIKVVNMKDLEGIKKITKPKECPPLAKASTSKA